MTKVALTHEEIELAVLQGITDTCVDGVVADDPVLAADAVMLRIDKKVERKT